MANAQRVQNYQLTADLDAPPIRSLDDFVLGSARFQVPQYNDLNKWSNRVTQNLLYYQSNYFIVLAIMFFLTGLLHPRDMIIGFICVVISGAIAIYMMSEHVSIATFKKERPFVGLVCMLLGGGLVITMISSVLVFLFALAFPMTIIFIHASLRLRNMKNKLANKAEAAGVTKTVMGRTLEILGYKNESLRME